MNPHWWNEWTSMWYAVGWYSIATRSNYNTADLLEICACLLMRINRLEAIEAHRPFLGLLF